MADLKNRIDFVYLFDVADGNPNGDPDNNNSPRTDYETGQGIVTDVCLKRKVRNYVQTACKDKPKYDIFIQEKAVLNDRIEGPYKDGIAKDEDKAREEMCKRYYDVRTFGAVMTTGTKKAGQVRGPIQLTFARSIDPVTVTQHTITRMAVTKKEDLKKERTMGNKSTVPYGLYVCHGFISPALAEDTKFSEEDLELFWQALERMFDIDHSAARGLMTPRGLIVFRHSTALGEARAADLFDRVRISRTTETAPRSFSDYRVEVDTDNLPEGVTVERRI